MRKRSLFWTLPALLIAMTAFIAAGAAATTTMTMMPTD
jgi:hypothetical protein